MAGDHHSLIFLHSSNAKHQASRNKQGSFFGPIVSADASACTDARVSLFWIGSVTDCTSLSMFRTLWERPTAAPAVVPPLLLSDGSLRHVFCTVPMSPRSLHIMHINSETRSELPTTNSQLVQLPKKAPRRPPRSHQTSTLLCFFDHKFAAAAAS